MAGRLPLLLAHLFTLPYRPLSGARPVAEQLLPAPARGLAVWPGSRHAPRLPEVAFESRLSRRQVWDRFPDQLSAASRSLLPVIRLDGLAGLRIRRILPGRALQYESPVSSIPRRTGLEPGGSLEHQPGGLGPCPGPRSPEAQALLDLSHQFSHPGSAL